MTASGHVMLSAAKNLTRPAEILRCAQHDMPLSLKGHGILSAAKNDMTLQ